MTVHQYPCPQCGQTTIPPPGTTFPTIATCPKCRLQFCCVAPEAEPEAPPVQFGAPVPQPHPSQRREEHRAGAPQTTVLLPTFSRRLSKTEILIFVVLAAGALQLMYCGGGGLFV